MYSRPVSHTNAYMCPRFCKQKCMCACLRMGTASKAPEHPCIQKTRGKEQTGLAWNGRGLKVEGPVRSRRNEGLHYRRGRDSKEEGQSPQAIGVPLALSTARPHLQRLTLGSARGTAAHLIEGPPFPPPPRMAGPSLGGGRQGHGTLCPASSRVTWASGSGSGSWWLSAPSFPGGSDSGPHTAALPGPDSGPWWLQCSRQQKP